MSNWRTLIDQLSDSFRENEQRLRILHELDQSVLKLDMRLEDVIGSVLKNVVPFSHSDFGCFYIHNEVELIPLKSEPPTEIKTAIPIDNNFLTKSVETSPLIFEDLSSNEDLLFLPGGVGSLSRLLVPVNHDGRIWGLLSLESSQDLDGPLGDPEIHEFLDILRRQLEIAVQFRSQQRDLVQLSRIQNELFTRELDISESLDSLIKNIIFALPDIGPLKVDPMPEIQILFYREKDDYLTIRATSGNEPVNTRLSVSDSISGLLVEMPQLPFFLCDPRNESGRYRSYLGRDVTGARRKEIRTELVVSLRHEGKIIGVINLESELEDAFKIPHVRAMEHLAVKVSPIINALQKRMEKTKLQGRANVYAMKKFLDRFANAYNHKMDTPIQSASLKLERIREVIAKDGSLNEPNKNFITEKLQNCAEAVDQIERYHHEFSASLPQYLTFGRYSINALIKSAIKDLRPKKLKDKDNIEVLFDPKADYEIFCSLFLREHIYNLLNNSVYAIRERKGREKNHKGKIQVETSVAIDQEERDLNSRCLIKIRDNGIGLDSNNLCILPNPFSTKPSGTGFGVSAAFQYLRGLGGGLTVASEQGKFFEATLYLDLYSEELHGRMDTFFEIEQEVNE